jgi:hypothetical protein
LEKDERSVDELKRAFVETEFRLAQTPRQQERQREAEAERDGLREHQPEGS